MELLLNEELSLLKYFSVISDPRREGGNKLHGVGTILGLSIYAIMSGAESWAEIEQFGNEKKEQLSEFLDLENGIPSHDTIGRVFGILDPEEFQRCFIAWVESIRRHVDKDIISIDGKTLRRSVDKANHEFPFHIVSAWSSENELSLGQIQVDKKSNEIIAIPELLKYLVLDKCIVTIDAMGCQKTITGCIREKKADYVLALKANHENLHNRAQQYFSDLKNIQSDHMESFTTNEKGHGRIEQRTYYFTSEINFLKPYAGFVDLQGVGMVEATRTINGETSKQLRYFISSLPKGAVSDFARAVRCHWGIENKLHWTLDVCMREDDCRVRKNYAAQNFAALRKIALNLIKQDTNSKISFRGRILKAAWSLNYALSTLFQKKVNLPE
jgi:predicted transposase YbfD/YdcC